MTAIPDHQRAELLRLVCAWGPHSLLELAQISAPLRLAPDELEAHLAALCAAGALLRAEEDGYTVYGVTVDAAQAARREYARLTGAQACRVCGCSDDWACPEGCFWVEPDLCTSCADPVEVEP